MSGTSDAPTELAALLGGIDPADVDGLLDRLDPAVIDAYLRDLDKRKQAARVLLRVARRRHKGREVPCVV